MINLGLLSALAAVASANSATVYFSDSSCNTLVRATTNGDAGSGRSDCIKDPSGNFDLYILKVWSSDSYRMMDLAVANKLPNQQLAKEIIYKPPDTTCASGFDYTYIVPGRCIFKTTGANTGGGGINYLWDITSTPVDGQHLMPDDGSCFNAKNANGLTPDDSYRQVRIINSGIASAIANPGDLCFSTTDCKVPSNAASVSCDTRNNLCTVQSCNKGYSLSADGKSCQGPNGVGASCSSDTNCDDGSAVMLPAFGSSLTCQSNVCLLSGCSNGFFVSADKKSCLAPVGRSCKNNACYSDNSYLSGLQASGTQCSNAQTCVITSCAKGYTLSADQTQCLANVGQSCSNNKCNEDTTYLVSHNANRIKCFGTCLFTACFNNYTLSSDLTTCLANVGASCSNNSPCNPLPSELSNYNATSVACTAGSCQLNACAKGFTLEASTGQYWNRLFVKRSMPQLPHLPVVPERQHHQVFCG
ncbi:hypothetical protein BC830DRAFT_1086482, partial [Chytriomyces sp. MP71]